MSLEVEYIPTKDLTPYAGNAKLHPAEQIEQIKKSIVEFGFNDPIAIWGKDNTIIEGHGRLVAAEELGMEKVPVIRLDNLTDEQRRAYTLVHNKLTMNTDFNFELLQMELDEINDIDMAEFGFDEVAVFNADERYPDGEKGSLAERFVAPPFSYLDTRQGYWQGRRKAWLDITGDLSASRDEDFGTFTESAAMKAINGGTSNFDPVLAELMYKWFCIPGGKILDPFAGEQTKGVVAGELGYKYTALDIRKEQIEIDAESAKKYKGVKYICGDSTKISKLVKDRDFDFCFTSPPYYDLEVYSKDDLSSLGTYEEFMKMYREIFSQCVEMLRENSFLVIKVGEIRDKKTGEYRSFVADNIQMFRELGLKYYNELVVLHPAGTAPIRANKNMETRKVVKLHQNVLVFYKGDLEEIRTKFPSLSFEEE